MGSGLVVLVLPVDHDLGVGQGPEQLDVEAFVPVLVAQVSMSAIASPPVTSTVATSTSTRPRSWTGTKLRRVSAPESSRVSPRSAPPGPRADAPPPTPRERRHPGPALGH